MCVCVFLVSEWVDMFRWTWSAEQWQTPIQMMTLLVFWGGCLAHQMSCPVFENLQVYNAGHGVRWTRASLKYQHGAMVAVVSGARVFLWNMFWVYCTMSAHISRSELKQPNYISHCSVGGMCSCPVCMCTLLLWMWMIFIVFQAIDDS